MDEVDALLEARASGPSNGNRAGRLEIINEFMAEWDGLRSAENARRGVIVMAATNRPYALDDAVLRRLPRRILIDLPDAQDRLEILRVICREDRVEEADLQNLAQDKHTTLFSGSDLANLARAAVSRAIAEADRELDATPHGPHPSNIQQPAILWPHWSAALLDFAPSLSRSAESLKQLRKWNAQYGDRTLSSKKQKHPLLGDSAHIGFE